MDLVKLQRGHESAFEHVLKEKQKRVEQKKAKKAERDEGKARERRKRHVAERATQYKFWEAELECRDCGFAHKPAATLCANCGGGRLKQPSPRASPRRDDEDDVAMFKALIAEEVKGDTEGATPEQQAV